MLSPLFVTSFTSPLALMLWCTFCHFWKETRRPWGVTSKGLLPFVTSHILYFLDWKHFLKRYKETMIKIDLSINLLNQPVKWHIVGLLTDYHLTSKVLPCNQVVSGYQYSSIQIQQHSSWYQFDSFLTLNRLLHTSYSNCTLDCLRHHHHCISLTTTYIHR